MKLQWEMVWFGLVEITMGDGLVEITMGDGLVEITMGDGLVWFD